MTTTTDDALTKDIALRLRYVREAQGLTQAELSELTDGELSKSRISNYEQGIRRMSLEAARALARPSAPSPPPISCAWTTRCSLTPDEIELIKKYRDDRWQEDGL